LELLMSHIQRGGGPPPPNKARSQSVYARIPFWWLDQLRGERGSYSGRLCAIAIALASHANGDGTNCFPSPKTLARATGIAEPAIYAGLAELRSRGIINWTGRGKSRRYELAQEAPSNTEPVRRTGTEYELNSGTKNGSKNVLTLVRKTDQNSTKNVLSANKVIYQTNDQTKNQPALASAEMMADEDEKSLSSPDRSLASPPIDGTVSPLVRPVRLASTKSPSGADLAAYAILDAVWPMLAARIGTVTTRKSWRQRNKSAALAMVEAGMGPEVVARAHGRLTLPDGAPYTSLQYLQDAMVREAASKPPRKLEVGHIIATGERRDIYDDERVIGWCSGLPDWRNYPEGHFESMDPEKAAAAGHPHQKPSLIVGAA
jgi:hypothetical protein